MDKLEVKNRIQDIRDLYSKRTKGNNFSALVMAEPGMGKTHFICTGRKPILIDSFDPRGTTIVDIKFAEELAKGDIIIRTFWEESHKNPKMYKKWEEQWEEDIKSGFLSHFGTYAIDSFSTFSDALTYKISDQKGRQGGTLARQDYTPLYNILKDIIKLSASQECDFILTAHLIPFENELTQEVKCELEAYRKLKVQIPLLFTEKYVLLAKPTSTGLQYKLLTQNTHRYRASTQLGSGGRFNAEEEPNIKDLLKKAGLPNFDKMI